MNKRIYTCQFFPGAPERFKRGYCATPCTSRTFPFSWRQSFWPGTQPPCASVGHERGRQVYFMCKFAPYGKNLDFNTLPRVNTFGLATLINVKYINCFFGLAPAQIGMFTVSWAISYIAAILHHAGRDSCFALRSLLTMEPFANLQHFVSTRRQSRMQLISRHVWGRTLAAVTFISYTHRDISSGICSLFFTQTHKALQDTVVLDIRIIAVSRFPGDTRQVVKASQLKRNSMCCWIVHKWTSLVLTSIVNLHLVYEM